MNNINNDVLALLFKVWVKFKVRSAFIEACQNFFNETIEYDILNEEPARFKNN